MCKKSLKIPPGENFTFNETPSVTYRKTWLSRGSCFSRFPWIPLESKTQEFNEFLSIFQASLDAGLVKFYSQLLLLSPLPQLFLPDPRKEAI